jgi:hypothetical protein
MHLKGRYESFRESSAIALEVSGLSPGAGAVRLQVVSRPPWSRYQSLEHLQRSSLRSQAILAGVAGIEGLAAAATHIGQVEQHRRRSLRANRSPRTNVLVRPYECIIGASTVHGQVVHVHLVNRHQARVEA